MSAWYTSWLPSLPSLNFDGLSSKVQRQFLLFVINKSLGHLLKPGQLDSSRIDSQIGSGYVQVNDLELDSKAINGFLTGLPITFDTGTIGSVTVRIPWPNPFTSHIGFFVKSLHLTFYLNPKTRSSHEGINLADSIASMAESFIHEELSPVEGANLWQSIHDEMIASRKDYIPGSLDPFQDSPDTQIPQQDDDIEPAGVSIFATLIERLLARFEFGIEDMKITLIDKGNMSISASFEKLQYKTDDNERDVTSEGETRSLTLTGLVITGQDLRPPPVLSPTQSVSSHTPASMSSRTPQTTRPSSPASSSSSLDEETHLAMSQSLAFLPPRPTSPASSVASSMYQSAISNAPTEKEDDDRTEFIRSSSPVPGFSALHDNFKSTEVSLVSFGTTPITLRMITPPPLANPGPPSSIGLKFPDGLRFALEMGIVACALHPWTIRGLVAVADCWNSHNVVPVKSAVSKDESSQSQTVALNLTSHIRGIIITLVTPSLGNSKVQDDLRARALDNYFLHPLVPPNFGQTYVRIHLEELSATLATSLANPDAIQTEGKIKVTQGGKMLLDSTISDISIFLFRPSPSGENKDMVTLPILVSDPNLPYQYNPVHLHPRQGASDDSLTFPMFEVKDWTRIEHHAVGPKLSYWRTRSKIKQVDRETRKYNKLGLQSLSPSATDTTEAQAPRVSPTLRIKVKKNPGRRGTETNPNTNIEVSVIPLYIFLDLSLLHANNGILSFIRDATETLPDSQNRHGYKESGRPENHREEDGEETTPPTTPGIWRNNKHDTESARRERLILDDLDLAFDYNIDVGEPERQERRSVPSSNPNITITLSMIRLEIRCPPPYGKSVRSGALIVDLHKLNVVTQPPLSAKRSARFAASASPTQNGSFLAGIECKRIVVACSPAQGDHASIVLSIGSLAEDNNDLSLSDALNPRVTITQTDAESSLSCSVELPSIHVDVSKPVADDLQYWADDVAQFFEHGMGNTTGNELGNTRESSLIGSRYFAKSRTGSGTGSITPSSNNKAGMVLKVTVLEAFCRLQLPRIDPAGESVRPFDISISDMDLLLELQPQGKTIITLDVMQLIIRDTTASDIMRIYLSMTSPRSMTGFPKPMLKLRFTTRVDPRTMGKESHVKLALDGFTCDVYPDIAWISAIATFAKSPPGTFEAVIPSERTCVSLNISDGSMRFHGPTHPGGMVVYVAGMEFSTDIVGDSLESSFRAHVQAVSVLATDDMSAVSGIENHNIKQGISVWKSVGYVLLAEVENLVISFSITPVILTSIDIEQIILRVHLCADTASVVGSFVEDVASAFQPPSDPFDPTEKSKEPAVLTTQPVEHSTYMSSIEELAFRGQPELGPSADMIDDDLPNNSDYLDESFGAAGGLREMLDEDLEDFVDHQAVNERIAALNSDTGITSKFGGETIKMLQPEGIHIIEDYLDNVPVDNNTHSSEFGEATLIVNVRNADFTLLLYDGYDWVKTRKTIEEGVKKMRKRLAKIRQLMANGQGQQPMSEETSALLFNSVYIGLEQDVEGLEPGALIAAIDEELKDDTEVGSESSWQSLPPPDTRKPQARPVRVHGKRLTRSKGPCIEFQLTGTTATFEKYNITDPLASRIFITIKDLEILDHIKTSSWRKFLTSLRSDSRGNIRVSDSNMVQIELRNVHSAPGHPTEEARLKAKILPLRLYVDQDALDFLKFFFSFKDQNADGDGEKSSSEGEAYIQLAEIFPVDLKLDYKPRRVDYKALREGKTIELMNFFHFDGAEMTLRHIELKGITGWAPLFDKLNDLWTPDVKATQLAEVISGVAPIRSMVNVGSGVADLILLPIAQYKKDGRIVRGMQKGATAFVKSTAIEAIKMGARLATGTQVILEQAEGALGKQFKDPITAEPVHVATIDEFGEPDFEGDDNAQSSTERYSKYADQPMDVKEGFQTAFKSVKTNINSAAQTILAVPMEVYERSGSEGPIRSVIRAVPIAVLKPMIGASEAVSKTLLGLHNTLDPNVRHENEAKYKQPR